jgi:basic amino acid/polyamine antiporter, APA family
MQALPSSSQQTDSAPQLIRGLALWPAAAIVIGDIIGSGVFLVSSDMARMVGSPTLVLAAWAIAGVVVVFGACCYAELGAALPHAGGPFVYLTQGLGPLFGFLFGWMSSLLERPVAMATLAAGFLRFAGFLFPAVATPLYTGTILSHQFTITAAQPLAALLVALVSGVNYLQVRVGGGIQILLTATKIGTLVLIIVGGLLLGKGHSADNVVPAPSFGLHSLAAVLSAMVPAMWAYNGFNNLGDLGEEIQRPGRNIPLAILLGLLTAAGLYLGVNAVYFRILPFHAVLNSQHVASDVVQSLVGSRGAAWLTIAMAISALGALHVTVMTGARIPFAMAREGLFFSFARHVHPTLHSPTGALVFVGIVGALLALTGTYEELYSLFVFAAWIFFALNAVALIRLRKIAPNLARPYRAFGYPWTPLLFIFAALALTINLWATRPVRSTIGLLVILAGVPFFYRWRSKHPR